MRKGRPRGAALSALVPGSLVAYQLVPAAAAAAVPVHTAPVPYLVPVPPAPASSMIQKQSPESDSEAADQMFGVAAATATLTTVGPVEATAGGVVGQ